MTFNPICPLLAVDVVVIYPRPGKAPSIAVIERKYPPLGLALPGGFVDVGESVEAAARREMKEELNIELVGLDLLGVYSEPNRDPRRHVVSVAFKAFSKDNKLPEAGDDAKSVKLIPITDLSTKKWCFDHAHIVSRAWLNTEAEF